MPIEINRAYKTRVRNEEGWSKQGDWWYKPIHASDFDNAIWYSNFSMRLKYGLAHQCNEKQIRACSRLYLRKRKRDGVVTVSGGCTGCGEPLKKSFEMMTIIRMIYARQESL